MSEEEDEYSFDTSEYGDWKLTSEQYAYVADQLSRILKDDDVQKYRMLLVEFGEEKVTGLLGAALIYGKQPVRDLFWSLIDTERSR